MCWGGGAATSVWYALLAPRQVAHKAPSRRRAAALCKEYKGKTICMFVGGKLASRTGALPPRVDPRAAGALAFGFSPHRVRNRWRAERSRRAATSPLGDRAGARGRLPRALAAPAALARAPPAPGSRACRATAPNSSLCTTGTAFARARHWPSRPASARCCPRPRGTPRTRPPDAAAAWMVKSEGDEERLYRDPIPASARWVVG